MEKTIKINKIEPKEIILTIIGDSDLVLNKMNDVTANKLIGERKDQAKKLEKSNVWEEVITSMHWLNGKPEVMSEQSLKECLNPDNNAPCITAFGLTKSFCDAVVRNDIDKYSTKFKANVNIFGNGDGLVPVKFAQHYLDEKLMSPKKGAPVLARLNRFSGWQASFSVSFIENVYSLEQIINIINLAGFGIGIGSGRNSGYGRYHVV